MHAMQGMRDAWEQVKEMRGREKERLHTDIVVKPGTGSPILAHKAILVSTWA
jgi:speckle-type POZ protein